MSSQHLAIRELAAWGFDDPIDRGSYTPEHFRLAACRARRRLEERKPYRAERPISNEQSQHLADVFATRKKAVAHSGEFDGLAWELAAVDLGKLIAFQRRIAFTDDDHFGIEHGVGWQELLDLALPTHPHSRSPYLEVASYCGRWFLRDGYHRSCRLLRQGMNLVPAVVVYAETLVQMGAIGSQFFAQDVLFSSRPPMVTDFLDDRIVLRYLRQRGGSAARVLLEPVEAGCHSQEGI